MEPALRHRARRAPVRKRLRAATAAEAGGRRRRDLHRPVARRRGITIYGDGEQTRDFVYVGDVVAAVLAAIGQPGGIFNIGTGAETSVNRALRRAAGGSPAPTRGRSTRRRGRATRFAASSTSRWPNTSSAGGRGRRSRRASASRGARAGRDARRNSRRVLARRDGHAHLGTRTGPAPDRRRLRAGERFPLPHLRAVGRALVPPDRGARVRGRAAGSRVLPGLSSRCARACLADRLARSSPACSSPWLPARRPPGRSRKSRDPFSARAARTTSSSTSPSTPSASCSRRCTPTASSSPSPPALSSPRRAGGRHGGRARRSRDGNAPARPRAPARARRAALARPRRPLARSAGAAGAAAGRRRSLRALSRLDARRSVGVHQRPGRLGSRGVVARPARWAARLPAGGRTGRPRSAGPPGRRARAMWSASLSGTSPTSPCSSVRCGSPGSRGAGSGRRSALYSVATLAIVLSVPAEGFPLVSLPRFLLGDFPLFLALASLTLDHPRARDPTLCAFAALGAVAAAAFARGIWVA